MEQERVIIKALAKEIAKRDLASLTNFVSGMKFDQAYCALNGYNRDSIIENGKVRAFFDLNYKSIATTIFMTNDGGCEVYDTADVWLDDISSPIDTVTIGTTKIKLQYQVKSWRSDRYEVHELTYECDPNKSDRDNLDDAFTKACELGADPNKNIRWEFID